MGQFEKNGQCDSSGSQLSKSVIQDHVLENAHFEFKLVAVVWNDSPAKIEQDKSQTVVGIPFISLAAALLISAAQ